MAATTQKSRMGNAIPIKLPDDLEQAVRATAEEGNVSDADVIRLALRKGLPSVKKFFKRKAVA
jgi:predicted transcriptional regulator